MNGYPASRLAAVRDLRNVLRYLLRWELEKAARYPDLTRASDINVLLERVAALDAEEARLEKRV